MIKMSPSPQKSFKLYGKGYVFVLADCVSSSAFVIRHIAISNGENKTKTKISFARCINDKISPLNHLKYQVSSLPMYRCRAVYICSGKKTLNVSCNGAHTV